MAAHISSSDYSNLDEHVKQFDKNCAVRGFTQEAAAWLGSGLEHTLDRKNLLRRKHFQVTHNANMIILRQKHARELIKSCSPPGVAAFLHTVPKGCTQEHSHRHVPRTN